MVRVSVFYPYTPGVTFDMTYYLEKHIPMVQKKLGSAVKGVTVDQGSSGGAPGAPMTYIAMAHILFDSLEAFKASFGAHAAEINADIPKYTAIKPIFQISEVKL
jgi:uncharacterized protein (TIGR02118 family)